MRKTALAFALSIAVAAAVSAPAAARSPHAPGYYAPAAGVIVGTTVGLGLYHGWFGATSLPATAAGAAATGFIAGVGTVALIDALTQPCKGFRAVFGGKGCVNGEYVGYRAR